MRARFRVTETSAPPSGNSFVLIGELTAGVVHAGMRIQVPVSENSAGIAPIYAVETLKDESHTARLALTILVDDSVAVPQWRKLNLVSQELRILEPEMARSGGLPSLALLFHVLLGVFAVIVLYAGAFVLPAEMTYGMTPEKRGWQLAGALLIAGTLFIVWKRTAWSFFTLLLSGAFFVASFAANFDYAG